jgi:hypothetical protein
LARQVATNYASAPVTEREVAGAEAGIYYNFTEFAGCDPRPTGLLYAVRLGEERLGQ